MPRCLECNEVYADNLWRCPHCGSSPEAPRAATAPRPAASDAKGKPARFPRGRARAAILVGGLALAGLGAVIAIPSSADGDATADIAPSDGQPTVPPPIRTPVQVKPAAVEGAFDIRRATAVGGEVLVEGYCSNAAVVGLRVNGRAAVIAPDGESYSARVPASGTQVEVVAIALDGKTAKLVADVVPAAEPEGADGLRVLSHANGQTVHVTKVNLQIAGAEGDEIREVELDRIENRIPVGKREFTLYRAPHGLAYLRTNETGQHTFLRDADGAEMVLVPAGIARRGMGREPPHGPAHTMKLSPYLIDRAEVTCAQYARFLKRMRHEDVFSLRHTADPGESLRPAGWESDETPEGAAERPVAGVSWFASFAYARWVGGRLPTEAEWERAGAGPHGASYPWGFAFDEALVARGDRPMAADSMPEGMGPFGLLHTSGNVREWCDDRFDPRWYLRPQRINPRGPSAPKHRVLRGGSFASSPDMLRLQYRDQLGPTEKRPDVGFRVVVRWIEPR